MILLRRGIYGFFGIFIDFSLLLLKELRMCIMIMLLYRLRGCVVYRWRFLVRFWIILMEMIGI